MKQLFSKKIFFLAVVLCISIQTELNAQCTPMGCSDQNNYGIFSVAKNNPNTLEYDNVVSGFHTTIARIESGEFRIWGEDAAADGVTNLTTITNLNNNAVNFPLLSGRTIYKVAIGGFSQNNGQIVALTDNGLYAWGYAGGGSDAWLVQGGVLHRFATGVGVTGMQKISGIATVPTGAVGSRGIYLANSFGLPAGVNPVDVKMMYASHYTLVITTCSGDVYVLCCDNTANAGDNSPATATTALYTQWHKVKKADGSDLTGIVAARGSRQQIIALDNTGNLWTWGESAYLGNGVAANACRVATAMTKPATAGRIKMFGTTFYFAGTTSRQTNYVLDADGKLFAVGSNATRQLGIWNAVSPQLSWVQPMYPNAAGTAAGLPMNDIAWISPQEHTDYYSAGPPVVTTASINVINKSGVLWAWGDNDRHMLNQSGDIINPTKSQIEAASGSNTNMLVVETGGHTTMALKSCVDNFGYVGHLINGSMASNDASAEVSNMTFTLTEPLNMCSAKTLPAQILAPTNSYNSVVNEVVPVHVIPSGGELTVLPSSTATYTLTGTTTDPDNPPTITLTSPGVVYLQYKAQCNATVEPTFADIEIFAGDPLSANFANVAANIADNALTVSWSTTSEHNNDHFEIQGSNDGKAFTTIGILKTKAAGGNSSELLEYTFSKSIDGTSLAVGFGILALGLGGLLMTKKRKNIFTVILLLGMGVLINGCKKNEVTVGGDDRLFIRIVQVDTDGTTSYSKVVTAKVK